jgi:hypothetical protein
MSHTKTTNGKELLTEKWVNTPLNKCTSFSTKLENTVSQLIFNLNSALIAADTWYLKGFTQTVKYYNFLIFLHIFLYSL